LHETFIHCTSPALPAHPVPFSVLNNPASLQQPFKDLSALQEANSLEHHLVQLKDGTQLILRGEPDTVPWGDVDTDGLTSYVHSQPGDYIPSGLSNDIGMLRYLGQSHAYTVTPGRPFADYFAAKFSDNGDWELLDPDDAPDGLVTKGNVLKP
jgi:hypothetical protein